MDVVNDRYELLEVIGSGGMGKVYRARDRVLDRVVAVKVIREELVDEEFLRRFEREAAILARVRSPHIVVVFDYGSSHGRFFLVTDFLSEGDLAQQIGRRGPLPAEEAARLLAGIADGLADAHANGVIHRDIKPGNVLLWRRGGELHPVLADFGIAVTADLGLTATGGVIGSPPFMAPERHLGRPATEATDIYAMGCLAYNLLTGAPPFGGTGFQVANAHINDPAPLVPDTVPRASDWNRVLQRCLRKEPAERYGSAAELAAAFRELARPAVPPPPPPPPPRPPAPPAREEDPAATVLPATEPRAAVPASQPASQPGSPAPARRRRLVGTLLALALAAAAAGGTWWLLREDPVAPPGDPGAVEAEVTSGNLAVAVAVDLPEPEPGTSIVVEQKDDEGVWREADAHLDLATGVGGAQACTWLRLVAVARDQRTEGEPAKVCGRAAPRTARLVASPTEQPCSYPLDNPDPTGATTTECRWADAVLTGFRPDEKVVLRLYWLVGGRQLSNADDGRISIDANGSGSYGQHDAQTTYRGLCPQRHCAGGYGLPLEVPLVELRVVDAAGRVVARHRVAPADVR